MEKEAYAIVKVQKNGDIILSDTTLDALLTSCLIYVQP